MSLDAICSVQYDLEPLNEKGYNFLVSFKKSDGSLHSRKIIQFQQQVTPQAGTVTDVFTKNAVCQTFSFETRDLAGLKKALKIVPKDSMGPNLGVFDFKEANYGYVNPANCSIAHAEESVVNFFINPIKNDAHKRDKDIHALFQGQPIQFILCEGSLKADILKKFEDNQIEFLNSKEYTEAFCICAEYFMNAFKQGQSPSDMQPAKYFKAITKGVETYTPQSESFVIYPSIYQEIYGPSSPYVASLAPVFNVQSKCNPVTGLATLIAGKK